MSPINWSQAQQAAINALGQNVLVSASAGAGKTTVLVGRLMKRMQVDRVPLDRIVALTFTELAAMEMRKRLAQALSEAYQSSHDPFLLQQIALLPYAQISTIHGFCLTLIQNYAYVLGLDPALSQNVLDEADLALYQERAFDEVYNEFLAKEPWRLAELVESFDAKMESIANFKEAIFKLATKLRSLDDPQAWLMQSQRAYLAQSFDTLDPQLKALVAFYLRYRCDRLEALINSALRHLHQDDALQNDRDEKQQLRIRHIEVGFTQMVDRLQQARAQLDPLDYSAFRSAFMELSQIGFARPFKQKEHPTMTKAIDRVETAYKDTLALLFEEARWFEAHPVIVKRLDLISQFVLAYQAKQSALKRADQVMDFDDMEHYALAILKDETYAVARQLQARYQEIVIDEFQDTNEVQNRIVELISNGTNLFRVGDVKQSIYRFRNAKPQMMMSLMQQANIRHLVLDENYRSKQTIVEFNNQLFTTLMNFPALPQRYTPADQVKIGLARQHGGLAVDMHLIKLDGVEEELESSREDVELDDSSEVVDEPNAHPKALYILSELQRMLKESPFKQFKDYVILVRSNDQKALFKDLLKKANLPHSVSTKTGFYQADAVFDVLHLYQHLMQPEDNVHLVAFLLSPYVKMDEESLAQLKLRDASLIRALRQTNPDLCLALDGLKEQIQTLNPSQAMQALIHFQAMYTKVSFQDQTNLDLLIQKVQALHERGFSLRAIVDQLLHRQDAESSEAIVSTDEDDVIRVMTIHQSKGLEFKVVFYWSTSSAPIQDNRAMMVMDTDLGMSLNTLDLPKRFSFKNPIRLAFEMKTMMEDVQEQLRLLYVALTRAQEKLIMVDVQPKWIPPLDVSTLLSSPGSTAWILAALSKQIPLNVLHVEAASPLKRYRSGQASEDVVSTPYQADQTLSFQSPSSTHGVGPRPRLNFHRTGGTVYGTRMHALFEHLPHQGVDEATILALDPDLQESDVHDVLAFYQDPMYAQLLQGDIHHELPFYIQLDQQLIHGYMDLVSVGQRIVLVDFKSDRVEHADALIEAYHDQIHLYQKVLKHMYPGREVRAFVYSTQLRQWIELT